MKVTSWVELVYEVPDELVGMPLWESGLKFVQDPIDPQFRLESTKVIMVDLA